MHQQLSYERVCLPANNIPTKQSPTIIRDHINGKTFSLTESIDAYIKFIQSYFNDYQRYEQLALSSFNEYVTRLNWDVAGKQVMELLRTCA